MKTYSDTTEAYVAGYESPDASEYHRYEVVKAYQAWKAAASEHAHTSYYGAAHVRNMRAWWLGVLRRQRAYNTGF
jgi:hypothetical protein